MPSPRIAPASLQDDALGCTDAVAEEQHVLRRQPQRGLEADLAEQVPADDHAGEVQKAPVLQHDAGEIREFRRVGGSSDSRLTVVISDSADTSEMVIELVAAL